MKRRKFWQVLLSCALAAMLALSSAAAYGEEYNGYNDSKSQEYTDVPPDYWAFNSIAVCSQRGWFNGYQDGSFHPTALITRDEAAKVFVEALALPWSRDTPVTFTDTEGNWAAGRIEAGKFLFPDATNLAGTMSFRPTQTITREETIYALVVAWRYASKVNTCDESVLNVFDDSHSISVGVRPYLAVAVQENLINGIPGRRGGTVIAAQKGLSRDEFATMLARALEHGYGPDKTFARPESKPKPEEKPQPKPIPEQDRQPIPEQDRQYDETIPGDDRQYKPTPEQDRQHEAKPEKNPAPSFSPEQAAGEILSLVNAERAADGQNAVALDDTLCAAAMLRSTELQTLFSHTRPSGESCFSVITEFKLPCDRTMGENIAAGQSDSAGVMNGWMNSAGHRANILKPSYTKLGVGCSADANGRLYWVQIFYS